MDGGGLDTFSRRLEGVFETHGRQLMKLRKHSSLASSVNIAFRELALADVVVSKLVVSQLLDFLSKLGH